MNIRHKLSVSKKMNSNQSRQTHYYFHFYLKNKTNAFKYSRFWRTSRGQKEGKDALVFWKLSSLFDESK